MSRSAYDPQEVEPKIARRWERAKAFSPPRKPRRGRKTYSVVLPPPNITGSLHMGHALNGVMQDALVRYHRMKGDDTVWVPGTDHAGIATQNVVERELQKEGRTRHDLGREQFVERVWAWKEKYGGIITQQLRRLGASCDWSRERFTLDAGYARAVQEAFIHYANNGLIYRGERIVNWCPRCASAISDLEVAHREEDAMLYTITYGPLALATVRPETKFGDTGVAVHPDDARYRQYVGKEIEIETVIGPARIRVVADATVDPSFGTGVIKVTPAHDFTDFDIGQRHGLPPKKVIGEDGRMNEYAGPFAGMTVQEARAAVVEALKKKGLLVKEEPYRHAVATCARCGTTIEPLISKQWFVKMAPLAKPAIEAAESGLVTFTPARWTKAYLDWLRGVKDWCVSRQLWWGHRLPVWYCQTGKMPNSKFQIPNSDAHVVFSVAKPKSCPECGGTDFEQDPDVLDTWFSSALWPFAVLGWPEATADLRRFYPTSALVTAPDILHLWVARMVFSGLEFMSGKHYLPAKHYGKRRTEQHIPFRDVIIHPVVLTLAGKRMSKSKGVVVDPLGLIDAYGADATRFGLLLQLREDQQALRFDENAVRAARNFINKLWNIARFIARASAQARKAPWATGLYGAGKRARELPRSHASALTRSFDAWVLSRLSETARAVTADLEAYRFGAAARALHDFVWDDFADWYVEVSKVPGMADANVARQVFVEILRLLHPFAPFVSERLWQDVGGERMLITSAWPAARSSGAGAAAAGVEVRRAQRVVQDVRSARMLLGIPAARKLRVRIGRPGAPLSLFPAIEFLGGCAIDMGKAEDWVQVPSREGALIALHRDDLVGADVAGRLAMAEKRVFESRRQIEKLEQQLRAMRQGAPRGVITEAERALAARRREFAEHEASVAALRALAKNP